MVRLEYVLLGRTTGTAFIDISDPIDPVYLGNLNTNTVSSLWRDIKVYNNYAFIVSEVQVAAGMQVFDLTKLTQREQPAGELLGGRHLHRLWKRAQHRDQRAERSRVRRGNQHRLWWSTSSTSRIR